MAGIKKLKSGTVPASEAGNSQCHYGELNWTYGANAVLTTTPGAK